MSPSVCALSSNSKGASFSNYEQQVEFRIHATNLYPARQVSALILQMDAAEQTVCVEAGGDVIISQDAEQKILAISHDYSGPEAADSAHRKVARFSRFKRTGHAMDEYRVHSIYSVRMRRPRCK